MGLGERMNIQTILSSEDLAIEYLDLHTPIDHVEQIVRKFDRCAHHIVNKYPSNSPIYLTAVEHNASAAESVFSGALRNNWVYVLVKCAKHLQQANELYEHPSPLIRTACAYHHSLALVLRNDANEYVRAACCQWGDVSELLIDDKSRLVRACQINNSEQMAQYYFKQGNPEDMLLSSQKWASCAKLLLRSGDKELINYAHHQLARMGVQ